MVKFILLLMLPATLFAEVIYIRHYYRDPTEDTATIRVKENKVWNGEWKLNEKEIKSLAKSYNLFENQIFIDVSLEDYTSFKKGLEVIKSFNKEGMNHSVRFVLKGEKVNCLSVGRMFFGSELIQSKGEIKYQQGGKSLPLDEELTLLKKFGCIYKIDSLEMKTSKGRNLFLDTLKKLNAFDSCGRRVFLYNLCFS